MRPRCTAMDGVSGSSTPCSAKSSRHRCFPPGVPAVRLEDQGHGREPVTGRVANLRPEVEEVFQARAGLGLGRPGEGLA